MAASKNLTAQERVQRARLAALSRQAAMSDDQRAASTERARRAALARFEKQVDPDGVLEPADRSRRAEYLKRAHMARMALASSRARARRKAS